MRLALVFGENNGKLLRDKLLRQKDNLDIDVFANIPQFIDSSIKRGRAYDRVVVLSNFVSESALNDLHQYWRSLSGVQTQVVLMCKSNKEEELAKKFMLKFQSPITSAMLVESSSMRIIIDSALLPVAQLNNTYGVKDYMNMSFEEDDEFSFESPSSNSGQASVQQPAPQPVQNNVQANTQQQTQQPAQQNVNNGKQPAQKKKKGGFLSSIFGSHGDIEAEQPQQNAQQSVQPQPQAQQDVQQVQNNTMQEDGNDFEEEDFGEQNFDQGYEEQYSDTQSGQYEQAYNDDFTSDTEVDSNSEFESDFADDDFGNQSGNDFDEDFSDMGADANFGADSGEIGYSDENLQSQPEPVASFDDGFSDFTGNLQVNQQTTSQQRRPERRPASTPKRQEASDDLFVDADFSSDTFSADIETVRQRPVTPVAEEVDTDLGDLNIASAENAYRRETEKPKVVEKIVTKEVIREVGGAKTMLSGVLSGRFRKIVIVTGDRGTGITSTAMNMVNYFSKKCPTLYFDCDVVRHGLLSYIDYGAFRSYEETHMNGTKLCKSARAFERCAMKFDTNLDILTSDFSCDTTDDELIETQSSVAEVSSEYNLVVVDCPIEKLPLLVDLHLTSCFVLCVEGTKRGMMNMLCNLESLDLTPRAKRNLANTGTMLITKAPKNLDMKKLMNFVQGIYEPADGIDWLRMQKFLFNGKFDEKLLNTILEG